MAHLGESGESCPAAETRARQENEKNLMYDTSDDDSDWKLSEESDCDEEDDSDHDCHNDDDTVHAHGQGAKFCARKSAFVWFPFSFSLAALSWC